MMRVGGGGPKLLNDVRFGIVRYTRGKGMDIGRGEYKAFPHFVGVRETGDDTIAAPVQADFLVESFDNLIDFVDGELDFIFVWGDVQANVFEQSQRLLKDGGRYIVARDRPEGAETTIWVKDGDGVMVRKFDTPRPAKSALVIRYGAIGDMLQTASVLPELKRQGYHVTLNSHPYGEQLLRHDPHVDSFFVQDPDQVPNTGDLLEYWKYLDTQYDRVVNLCESVEGTLLLYPGRSNHRWPHAMRKKYCNKNYLEFMAEVAELPFHPEYRFYSTQEEQKRAIDFLAPINDSVNQGFIIGQATWKAPYVIMWALSGSSVHKVYPHQDAVVAQILLNIPNAHIIFVGDAVSSILEGGWQNEKRISCMSGKMELRDVLTLAPLCQLVIGPETGVLNSVAFENNAKIVLLSHSTEENLTRDWVNTESLHSTITPCWPCHRLHYGREFCPHDETTKAAMCQMDLPPSDVWAAVQRAYVGWGTVRQLLHP